MFHFQLLVENPDVYVFLHAHKSRITCKNAFSIGLTKDVNQSWVAFLKLLIRVNTTTQVLFLLPPSSHREISNIIKYHYSEDLGCFRCPRDVYSSISTTKTQPKGELFRSNAAVLFFSLGHTHFFDKFSFRPVGHIGRDRTQVRRQVEPNNKAPRHPRTIIHSII